MYYPGQVVYNLVTKEPVKIGDNVWDARSYPKEETTHFIALFDDRGGKAYGGTFLSRITIAFPKSIEEAKLWLSQGIIAPALKSSNNCWSCGKDKADCSHAPTVAEASILRVVKDLENPLHFASVSLRDNNLFYSEYGEQVSELLSTVTRLQGMLKRFAKSGRVN